MADGVIYRDAIVITTVKQVGLGDDAAYQLDLPFTIYGQDIFLGRAMVTYNLKDVVGQTVIAKVDYKAEDEAKVKAFPGYLANPLKDATYAAKYPVTKEEALATVDVDGKPVLYKGADKADSTPFAVAISFDNVPIKIISAELDV